MLPDVPVVPLWRDQQGMGKSTQSFKPEAGQNCSLTDLALAIAASSPPPVEDPLSPLATAALPSDLRLAPQRGA
jgi:hypothetical protein